MSEPQLGGAARSIPTYTRVTLYTAWHLHTAVSHCSHSRAPIVHTAVPRENNEHGCVYLRCRAVCKLPGCVEGHPWYSVVWSGMGNGNRGRLNIKTPTYQYRNSHKELEGPSLYRNGS